MPHLVKNIANALERSGLAKHKTTDLRLNGNQMTLKMLEDLWLQSPDSSVTENGILSYRFTREHFDKNAYD